MQPPPSYKRSSGGGFSLRGKVLARCSHCDRRVTDLRYSNSWYFLRYLFPLRYGLSRTSGLRCSKSRPMSLVTLDASWNMGSKTIRFVDPDLSFSMPTMVKEWPGNGQRTDGVALRRQSGLPARKLTRMLPVDGRQPRGPDLGRGGRRCRPGSSALPPSAAASPTCRAPCP